MVANAEECVVAMANPSRSSNLNYHGHHFSRELLGIPELDTTTGMTWYDSHSRALHGPFRGMTHPQQEMMGMSYPTYPYSNGQMQQQQHGVQQRCYPSFDPCRSAFSPPNEVSLTRFGRTKRTRPTSLDTPESSVGEHQSSCEDASTDSSDVLLPDKRQCSNHKHFCFPEDGFGDEGKHFRRYSSRQKRKTSFFGVTGDQRNGTIRYNGIIEPVRFAPRLRSLTSGRAEGAKKTGLVSKCLEDNHRSLSGCTSTSNIPADVTPPENQTSAIPADVAPPENQTSAIPADMAPPENQTFTSDKCINGNAVKVASTEDISSNSVKVREYHSVL